MTTRSKSEEVLKHLMENVLVQSSDSDLSKALERDRVDSFPALMSMTKDEIEMLTFAGNDGKIVPLHRSKQSLVRALKSFIYYNQELGKTEYLNLTEDDFNIYRVEDYNPDDPHKPVKSTATSSASRKGKPTPNQRPPAEDFKKSIKRNTSDYIVLKQDKQWDDWLRSTMATARSHACDEVLNPAYKPKGQEDIDLFTEKQKFMYSVFDKCLQTDMGKYFVRQHDGDSDAQAIFRKLSQYATASTQAALESSDLLAYITTATFTDLNWRGTTQSFILNWCDKLRKWEKMVPLKDHFTGPVKKVMLENAVSGVEDLHNVKTAGDREVSHGKPPLTYQQYKSLLLSAASNHDRKLGLTRKRNKQRVFQHEQSDDNDIFDIDTDINTLDINATNHQPTSSRPFRPSMKKEQWNSLNSEEKALWDHFSPTTKAMILGYSRPKPSPLSMNLHDMSAAEYISMFHSQDTPEDATDDKDEFLDAQSDHTDEESNEEKGDILAYATKQSLPPGDLRRVLSSASGKKTPPKLRKNEPDNTSAHTMTINGKQYHQVNTYETTTYHVSKHAA